MRGRIYFPGNPWPEGHPLAMLIWSGRLDAERGLIFDLHLKSKDYYAEREIEYEETDSDYKAPIVWGNYHACTLSSNFWHQGGWVAGTPREPLSFTTLEERVLSVDSLTEPGFDVDDVDDRSFHIYLLGHDDVAEHKISFSPDGDTWKLDWRGLIALAYSGNYEFEYPFKVEASGVTFDGFTVGPDFSDEAARFHLNECCLDAGDFELVVDGDKRLFKLGESTAIDSSHS